eukprot:g29862.t1
MDINDKDAAPIDVVEATMEPKYYAHPTVPNMMYWDIHKISSVNFEVKKFLKEIKFSAFDFGLIVSDLCFREEDEVLAKAMKKP